MIPHGTRPNRQKKTVSWLNARDSVDTSEVCKVMRKRRSGQNLVSGRNASMCATRIWYEWMNDCWILNRKDHTPAWLEIAFLSFPMLHYEKWKSLFQFTLQPSALPWASPAKVLCHHYMAPRSHMHDTLLVQCWIVGSGVCVETTDCVRFTVLSKQQ